MASARRIAVNPAAPEQRYIQFSSNRLVNIGGAPPIENEGNRGDGFVEGSPPSAFGDVPEGPFLGLQITDWAEPSGYTGDHFGVVWAFGEAANTDPFGHNIFPATRVVDFVADPAGTGEGYVLTSNGLIHPIGGASVIGRNRLKGDRLAVRIYMDWATREYWVLDQFGGFHARHGAPAISVGGRAAQAKVYNQPITAGACFKDITTGEGWLVTKRGQFHSLNGTDDVLGGPRERFGRDEIWSDVALITDGEDGDPLRFTVLSIYGTEYDFVVSSSPTVAVGGGGDDPAPPAVVTDTTRPEIGWAYRDADGDAQAHWDLRIIAESEYDGLPDAEDEVKELAITGAPTGGDFPLLFEDDESDPIAWNANAAAVEDGLETLPQIEPGDVSCSGGPLPGTPVLITFTGRLGAYNVPTLSADSDGLTGGSSPEVVITVDTPGELGAEPDELVAVYTAEGTEPDDDAHTVAIDLDDDTYRAYMRVTDSSQLQSLWAQRQFDVLVDTADLVVPVVTPTIAPGLGITLLDIETTPNPTEGVLVAVLYRDSVLDDWHWVRDAWNLVPDDDDGEVTAIDPEPPLGRVRQYRAFMWDPDPFRAGAPSSPVDGPLHPAQWLLSAPDQPLTTIEPEIIGKQVDHDYEVVAGTHRPLGRLGAVVRSDGPPKGAEFTLPVRAIDRATDVALWSFLDVAATLLVRDPFGRATYVRLHRALRERYLRGGPDGQYHELEIPFIATDRPLTGPTVDDGPITESGVV